MKKPAILITSNFSSNTGCAWKFFFRLFNAISNTFHDRGIAISLSFAKVVEPVRILDDRLPFTVFAFDPLNIKTADLLSLRKNIKINNIKYCYLTDLSTWHWVYPLMRSWGVRKIIVHNHVSVAYPYRPPAETGVRKILKTVINRSRLLSADQVFACSEFVKDRLVRKACYPEDRIKVIFHGIDVERFRCRDTRRVDDGKIVIFTVARATRDKGIHILIEAAKLLRDKYSFENFVVEYGGDGPDMAEFKGMVKEYGLEDKFLFLGELDDTRDCTRKADIVVVPSCWGDAFPLSVLEAMSAGKPVIATDVGGIPEEIGPDGCGILVKPRDAESLATELTELMRNASKRRTMGEKARTRAAQHFTESRFHKEVVSGLLAGMGLNPETEA